MTAITEPAGSGRGSHQPRPNGGRLDRDQLDDVQFTGGRFTDGRFTDGRVRFALAMVGIFGVLSALSTDDGPVLCPLRRCSGGYCPACGLTRSGGRLLRGDLAGSWGLHPYLLIAVGQVGAAAAVWGSGSAAARRWLGSIMRPALIVNVGIMAAVWVIRMVDGSIPVPFFS